MFDYEDSRNPAVRAYYHTNVTDAETLGHLIGTRSEMHGKQLAGYLRQMGRDLIKRQCQDATFVAQACNISRELAEQWIEEGPAVRP
jgi:hypothetical protein